MNASILDMLQEMHRSKSVLLTTHINPDGDALGSLLAMYRWFIDHGKQVDMWVDDSIAPIYSFLPGIHEIKKPGIQVSKAELMIVLDAGDIGRIGKVAELFRGRILNIDHHISNNGFADFSVIDTEAAATGEIIYRIFETDKYPINSATATCIFTAIATDCGFFRYSNTSPDTLRFSAELVQSGAMPSEISENLETYTLEKYSVLTSVLNSLELSDCGKIAMVTMPFAVSQDDIQDSEGFVDFPRRIQGVEIAILFKPTSDNSVKVSFRSRSINVSELAAVFGGGGHARAAGCTIKQDIESAKKSVLVVALKSIHDKKS